MNPKQLTHLSKFLSLVLRHQPEEIGLTLDEAGWVSVDALLTACANHRTPITRAQLDEIVETNAKKRFAFNDDRTRIRASQGHSVAIELGYPPSTPPELLYHGTHADALASIRVQGLHKGERHHVHLTANPDNAVQVGQRRGSPIVLSIAAAHMHGDGHLFYLSENNVWLTDHVPPQYLTHPTPPDRGPHQGSR